MKISRITSPRSGAMNEERTLLSRDGVKQALQSCSVDTPPATISQCLLEQVKRCANGQPQSDDMAIRYYGTETKRD